MAYSAEILQRARARLAREKEEKEEESRRHLALAYAQVPRLRQIDSELRRTMAQAAQAAFARGEDGRQAMAQVRAQNRSLQQERQALIEGNFEPGFLDESPICPKCGGSGYIGSAMCTCLAELCAQEQKKALTLLAAGEERFDRFRLDLYPDRVDPNTGVHIRSLMEKTANTCRRYAENFSESSENLLFSGSTGLGKTFLSACIARRVAERGYSVIYESAAHLFSKLERARFGGDEADRHEAQMFTECDLLIMDDLGTEMPGQFVNAALYTLINDRLLQKAPMIISTNLTNSELEHRYTPQIVSRLRGSFRRVPFVGDDIRILKSRGQPV